MSIISDEEEDEDEVLSKKSKVKAKSQKSAPAASAVSGGFSLLTAAERREQAKKDGKKATEDPYSFLLDINDVRGLHSSSTL